MAHFGLALQVSAEVMPLHSEREAQPQQSLSGPTFAVAPASKSLLLLQRKLAICGAAAMGKCLMSTTLTLWQSLAESETFFGTLEALCAQTDTLQPQVIQWSLPWSLRAQARAAVLSWSGRSRQGQDERFGLEPP